MTNDEWTGLFRIYDLRYAIYARFWREMSSGGPGGYSHIFIADDRGRLIHGWGIEIMNGNASILVDDGAGN